MTERRAVEEAVRELGKAVNCLYLAVEPSIADDVRQRFNALVAAIREAPRPAPAATEDVLRLRGLLADVQWVQPIYNGAPSCSGCGELKHLHRDDNCPIAEELARPTAPAPATTEALRALYFKHRCAEEVECEECDQADDILHARPTPAPAATPTAHACPLTFWHPAHDACPGSSAPFIPAPAAPPGVVSEDYRAGVNAAADYVVNTLAANHPHLADAYRHAAYNIRAALTDAPLRSCDACGRRGPWPVQQAERADRETGHRGTRTLCDQCAPGAGA